MTKAKKKDSNDKLEKAEEDDSVIPDGILEGIEDEQDKNFIQRSLSIMGRFPTPNPLSKKITSEHIGQLIENSDKQDQRESRDKNWKRAYHLITIIIAICFVSFLIYTFKDNNAVLVPMITGILTFLGGIGVGKSI